MDNLFEIIVPLIFAAIYFFGNMLSGKKESEDAPPAAPRRAVSSEDEEAAERQRRIQEEIRRKIMERRRANSGEGPARTPPPREVFVEEPAPIVRTVREPEPVVARRSSDDWDAHEASATREAGANVFWEVSDDIYSRGIESRMQRIEATNRQAEQLKRQAAAARKKANQPRNPAQRPERSGGTVFKGSVRQSLRDPSAARAAFIYGEVLGRPIGMRDASTSQVPGLTR